MAPVQRRRTVHVHVLNMDIPSSNAEQLDAWRHGGCELLVELSRLGRCARSRDTLGTTTSTVSQQLAVLAREMGAPLIEPDGRRSGSPRPGAGWPSTPSTILAAVESGAPRPRTRSAEPNGTLRVAGFATAIRAYLLPVVTGPRRQPSPAARLVREHEPAEALQLLAADEADLALAYDYNLAPAAADPALHATAAVDRALGPRRARRRRAVPERRTTLEVFARFRTHDWIVNSRNTADEDGHPHAGRHGRVHTPHHPPGRQPRPGPGHDRGGSRRRPAADRRRPPSPRCGSCRSPAPRSTLRAFAVARHGHLVWPPLSLVTDLLAQRTRRN